jgi:hypothetical protein
MGIWNRGNPIPVINSVSTIGCMTVVAETGFGICIGFFSLKG